MLEWGLALPTVFVSASLAVGAGIGGGALFVGAYILILGMDAHGAVPLSKGGPGKRRAQGERGGGEGENRKLRDGVSERCVCVCICVCVCVICVRMCID